MVVRALVGTRIGRIRAGSGGGGAALEQLAIAAAQANGASLWYAKSDLSNVFSDSAGTAAAALNGPVGRVNDGNSATNIPALQSTAGNKPTLVAGPLEYPVLSFNGSTGSLVAAMSSSFGGNTDKTITAAINFTGGSNGMVPAALGTNSSNNAFGLGVTGGGATFGPFQYGGDFQSPPAVSNSILVASGVKVGNTLYDYRNGVLNNSGVVAAANVTSYNLTIGSLNQLVGFLSGRLGLVAIAPAGMPSADRRAIERFGAYIIGAPYQ